MPILSRRDILKLTAFYSAGGMLAVAGLRHRAGGQTKKPNIIILLADATSAPHLSLYGYRRHTTPNLERLAERALVYHAHHAGGNFTTPGTASLLTGTYPWTHRAINLGSVVQRRLAGQNIFQLLGDEYFRAGFSQNFLAEPYLRQFTANVDLHVPISSFYDKSRQPFMDGFFKNDPLMASYAVNGFLLGRGSALMTYFSLINMYQNRSAGDATEEFPYGMPSNGVYFYKNDVVYDGVHQVIRALHRDHTPFFAYFHLMSPHSPYSPSRGFVDTLEDISFPTKKMHPLGNHVSRADLHAWRKQYDEYVANVDAEMGRLIDSLQEEGILDNTYLFILADHGDMFERGVLGHVTPLLYEPVTRIPLIVFAPGHTSRTDITTPTSNTDILPTILSLAGRPIPDGVEGRPLAGLGGREEKDRAIFTVEAKESSSFQPLTRVSVSMVRGTKKMLYFKGYEKYPNAFELYDLEQDPEEKRDLYAQDTETARSMKDELLNSLDQADKPFQH